MRTRGFRIVDEHRGLGHSSEHDVFAESYVDHPTAVSNAHHEVRARACVTHDAEIDASRVDGGLATHATNASICGRSRLAFALL